jgi:hypothetical protein
VRRVVKLSISTFLALLLGAALVISAAGSTRRGTLAVVARNPVVVTGRGFLPRERVTLRTSLGGHVYRKTVVASRIGRFTTRFADANAECSPFAVSATGARGTRATTRKIAIPPPCGMVITP